MDAPKLADRPSRLARLRSSLIQEATTALVPSRVLVARGARTQRRVALTFDDGPDEMTPSYLALLKRLDVRATFFVIGDNARKHPKLIRAYVEHGHEVLSHGMTHTPFPRLSHDALLAELRETQALLPPPSRVPTLVRPPQGAKTLKSLYQVAAAGFTSALWSLDSDDCRTTDPAEVSNRVVTMARGGDVILLHEFQQWTLDALTSAVAGLRMRSLVPVTMSDLLRSEP